MLTMPFLRGFSLIETVPVYSQSAMILTQILKKENKEGELLSIRKAKTKGKVARPREESSKSRD